MKLRCLLWWIFFSSCEVVYITPIGKLVVVRYAVVSTDQITPQNPQKLVLFLDRDSEWQPGVGDGK